MEIIQKIKNYSIPFAAGLLFGILIISIIIQPQKRELLNYGFDFGFRSFSEQNPGWCNNIPTGVLNESYAMARMNFTLATEKRFWVRTAELCDMSTNTNIQLLLKQGFKVTSLPGLRLRDKTIRGIGGGGIIHDGYDLAMKRGTAVRSFSDGRVYRAGWSPSWGWQVIIEYPDGTRWRYAHMMNLEVRRGQTVYQDQIIGKCGNTGNSRGAHLHYGEVK